MQQAHQRLRVIKVLLIGQLIGSLIVGLVGLGFGGVHGMSALMGGLICWLPNCYFAFRAFRYQGARAARQIVNSFYVGEAGKMLLTMALFALVFINIKSVSAIALFAGYFAVQLLNWAVPLFVSQREARN